ncbi:hypothetical protein [Mesorhizobium captivum]|nr:hypothetical protein [Mesorhizobium sp. VK23E]MDX8513802.1 hypothetical protein [Mesorhizobium sp. VK23E]
MLTPAAIEGPASKNICPDREKPAAEGPKSGKSQHAPIESAMMLQFF